MRSLPIRFLRIGVIVFACISQVLASEQEIEQVVKYDALVLKGRLSDDATFEIAITLQPYSIARDRLKKFWGNDAPEPDRVMHRLSLHVSGYDIKFPDDSIRDLADINLPQGVYLTEGDSSVTLHLKGGDAAGAYSAALKIKNGRVISRTIEFINSSGDSDSIVTNY